MHQKLEEIRTIKWKLNLNLIKINELDSTRERQIYADLIKKYSQDDVKIIENLEIHNPLSLSDQSVWKYKFEDQELKREITQDVARILPEVELFRDLQIRKLIENVLFIWSKENSEISYRQGMHELVAVVYLAVHCDSRDNIELFKKEFIEIDTMILFFGLMKEMKKWYRVGRDAPILATSIKIFSLLQARDTELYDHLHTLGVEPQVFCIRWLRLLFLREFPINQVLECWDGIVTDGLELVEWVAVAMLVHIREEMLAGGYDVVMNLLMRYPPLKCSMPELLESAFLLKKRPVSRSSEISLSTPPMEQIKQILLHSVALLDDSSTISLVKAELQRAIAICDTDRTSTTEKKPLAMKKAVSLDRTAPMPFELVSFGSIDLKEQVRAGVSGINKAVQSLTATNIPSNHWLFSPKAPSKEH